MNSPQFPSEAMNIPQSVLDHYHSHYSNDAYRAFSDALADHLPGGTAHPDHVAVMNMLTDAAFERAGAEVYRGAAVQLGMALVQLNALELCVLAEQHLRRFNPDHMMNLSSPRGCCTAWIRCVNQQKLQSVRPAIIMAGGDESLSGG